MRLSSGKRRHGCPLDHFGMWVSTSRAPRSQRILGFSARRLVPFGPLGKGSAHSRAPGLESGRVTLPGTSWRCRTEPDRNSLRSCGSPCGISAIRASTCKDPRCRVIRATFGHKRTTRLPLAGATRSHSHLDREQRKIPCRQVVPQFLLSGCRPFPDVQRLRFDP